MLLGTIQIAIAWMTRTHRTRHGQFDGKNFGQIKSFNLRTKQAIQRRD
jgi:hypothetical protein